MGKENKAMKSYVHDIRDRFSYKGYQAVRSPFSSTWFVSKDGFHICEAGSEDAARAEIDRLCAA